MNPQNITLLRGAFEGLLQAGACFDSILIETPGEQHAELIEAATVDADRAFRAVLRILALHNAVPECAGDIPATFGGESGDIPF